MDTLMKRLIGAGIQVAHLEGSYAGRWPHVETIVVPSDEHLDTFHVWAAEHGAVVEEASVGTLAEVIQARHLAW